jgi:hypothetical protein
VGLAGLQLRQVWNWLHIFQLRMSNYLLMIACLRFILFPHVRNSFYFQTLFNDFLSLRCQWNG